MLVGMKSKKKNNPFYVFPFADYLLFIMSLTGLSVLEGKVIVMDIKQAPCAPPRHASLCIYLFMYPILLLVLILRYSFISIMCYVSSYLWSSIITRKITPTIISHACTIS
jgi:hypothetical protein